MAVTVLLCACTKERAQTPEATAGSPDTQADVSVMPRFYTARTYVPQVTGRYE